MKLELNLEQDAELRKEVKKMVTGQLRGIIREEIRNLVHDEVKTKVESIDVRQVYNLMNDSIDRVMLKYLREEHEISRWTQSGIQNLINIRVERFLDENKLIEAVDAGIKIKLKKLVG